MNKRIKVIIISILAVLLLNTVLFSFLTVYQAPYYEDAPAEMSSIYEMYASDEYNAVVYRDAIEFISDEDEIQKISETFKSTYVVKLSKFQSYLKMFSLNKGDFVFGTISGDYGDRKIAAEKLIASHVFVYLKNNDVYVVCTELTEQVRDSSNMKIAIYEAENESEELLALLKEHKATRKTGIQIFPEWRTDISKFSENLSGKQYLLFFFIEFVVAVILINSILGKKEHVKNSSENSKKIKKKIFLKERIKVIIASIVALLLLNTVLFAILTVYQAPYYEDAPAETNSIYEMYASEEYKVMFYMGAHDNIYDEAEIQRISDALKSTSVVKLNKMQSYLKMLSLNKENYVFSTYTQIDGDINIAAEKLIAENVIVYLEDNKVYVACFELKGPPYGGSGNVKIAMYEAENETEELLSLLKEYKPTKKIGNILPDWRQGISGFPDSFSGRQYFLLFVIEIILTVFITSKIFGTQNGVKDTLKSGTKKEK